MTEDHCVAGDGWLQSVVRAHEAADAAVGGAVENGATDRVVDWAVYFCEYGRYMLPSTCATNSGYATVPCS